LFLKVGADLHFEVFSIYLVIDSAVHLYSFYFSVVCLTWTYYRNQHHQFH